MKGGTENPKSSITTKKNKLPESTESKNKTSDKEDEDKKKEELEKKRAKYIEDTLNFGIQSERKDAINKIKLIKNEDLKKKLIEKLIELIRVETDKELVMKAIYTAGELKVTKSVGVITDRIDDNSEDVVTAAVYSLKKLEGISAKEKLIKKLKEQDFSKNSNLTEAMIQTLGSFKAKELIDTAIKTIKSNKTARIIRHAFVIFLGNLGSEKPKDFLIGLYKDREEEILLRSYAVNSLARLGIKGVIKEINEVLSEIDSFTFKKRKKYYGLKLYSIAALVKLGDKNSIPRLINSLKSNNSRVRLRSIKLIAELKDKRTIDILKYKVKYDPNAKVRKAAEKALKDIEPEVEKDSDKKKGNKPAKK